MLAGLDIPFRCEPCLVDLDSRPQEVQIDGLSPIPSYLQQDTMQKCDPQSLYDPTPFDTMDLTFLNEYVSTPSDQTQTQTSGQEGCDIECTLIYPIPPVYPTIEFDTSAYNIAECETTEHPIIPECETPEHPIIPECETPEHSSLPECETPEHSFLFECETPELSILLECETPEHSVLLQCETPDHPIVSVCETPDHPIVSVCETPDHSFIPESEDITTQRTMPIKPAVTRRAKENGINWRSSTRNRRIRCYACFNKTGEEYTRGHHKHCHPSKVSAGKGDVSVSAADIVDEVIAEMTTLSVSNI